MTQLAAEALDQLLEITTLLRADMDAGLGALGLTQPKAHLLFVLASDGPQAQRGLAEQLGVSPRAVTGYVDDLAAAGLVTREPHPTDRRITLVTPTDAGQRLSEQLVSGRETFAEQLFDGVDERELQDLVGSLDAALARLRTLVEQGRDQGATP